MINKKKILTIIPARKGSKGLPLKNIKDLCGRPLLGWPIQAALKSRYVDRVIVSTDDQAIADVAVSQGAEAPFLRPGQLASDTATSISVMEHAIDFFHGKGEMFDYLVLLEPTSPLTDEIDIDRALEKLDSQRNIADSIVGISKVEAAHPVFDVKISDSRLIEPYMNGNFAESIRRQDLADIYFFDGSLYISGVTELIQKKTFYHERTLAFITPKWKSFEIDDLVDFICVEAIMKNLKKFKKSAKD